MAVHATSQRLPGELLFQTAVFEALGRRRCDLLAHHATEREYITGDVVFGEGSPPEGLVLLAQGTVRLSVNTGLGGSVSIREQTAPAAIVTAGLLDGGPNGVTALASSTCLVYMLHRGIFVGYCRQHPDLMIRLLAEIGQHLRCTSAFIDLIIASGTRQRLARALLDLMEEAGHAEFVLPCNHAELAARLGTVRELIYRNLKLLEGKRVLSFSGKRIVVNDAAALVAEARRPTGAPHVFEAHGALPNPACFVLHSIQGQSSR